MHRKRRLHGSRAPTAVERTRNRAECTIPYLVSVSEARGLEPIRIFASLETRKIRSHWTAPESSASFYATLPSPGQHSGCRRRALTGTAGLPERQPLPWDRRPWPGHKFGLSSLPSLVSGSRDQSNRPALLLNSQFLPSPWPTRSKPTSLRYSPSPRSQIASPLSRETPTMPKYPGNHTAPRVFGV